MEKAEMEEKHLGQVDQLKQNCDQQSTELEEKRIAMYNLNKEPKSLKEQKEQDRQMLERVQADLQIKEAALVEFERQLNEAKTSNIQLDADTKKS